MSGTPRYVLFDVDGVLVQSMPCHFEAYRRVFAEKGVELSELDVYEREGKKAPEVIASIAEERGLHLGKEEHEAMWREKQRIFLGFGPQPLYPYARALVDALHAKGVRTALVTGTFRENVKNHLGEFMEHFDAVVSSDDVTHTKPHPEPYLKGMEKIGATPEDAVVIENAPQGILAAKAAGVRVLAVTTTLPEERLKTAGADEVFPDLAAVAERLGVRV